MASTRSPTARKPARTAAATPQRGFGLSYNFACPVCGKTFKRNTYDAPLNAHKNKQGRPCPGRVGVLKAK
jgi:primosomal protein N'